MARVRRASSTLYLYVHDLIVTRRAVEVPALCLGCGANLIGEGTLRVLEYETRMLYGVGADVNGEPNFDDYVPSWLEGELTRGWCCNKCGRSLVQADETSTAKW